MNVANLKKVFESICAKIEKEPAGAFAHFKNEWSKLGLREKEVLVTFLNREYKKMYEENKSDLINQMHFTEIMVEIKFEYEGLNPMPKLRLDDDVKDVEIAKLFYLLRKYKRIYGSNEELAKIIAQLFDRNFETIFSNLSNPKRIEKAKSLL